MADQNDLGEKLTDHCCYNAGDKHHSNSPFIFGEQQQYEWFASSDAHGVQCRRYDHKKKKEELEIRHRINRSL